jgi:hypothetical protein
MAYLNLLASVAEAQVQAVRQESSQLVCPSMVSGASHLLAYWVKVQPLGQLLHEALDGGELLHSRFWHPLRPPMLQHPAAVQTLTNRITDAWEEAQQGDLPGDREWLAFEIGRLLRLFRHAAGAGECVVSALERSGHPDRADRMQIPWRAV